MLAAKEEHLEAMLRKAIQAARKLRSPVGSGSLNELPTRLAQRREAEQMAWLNRTAAAWERGRPVGPAEMQVYLSRANELRSDAVRHSLMRRLALVLRRRPKDATAQAVLEFSRLDMQRDVTALGPVVLQRAENNTEVREAVLRTQLRSGRVSEAVKTLQKSPRADVDRLVRGSLRTLEQWPHVAGVGRILQAAREEHQYVPSQDLHESIVRACIPWEPQVAQSYWQSSWNSSVLPLLSDYDVISTTNSPPTVPKTSSSASNMASISGIPSSSFPSIEEGNELSADIAQNEFLNSMDLEKNVEHILEALAQNGYVDGLYVMLERMHEQRVPMTAEAYRAFMEGYVRVGMHEQALGLLPLLLSEGHVPEEAHYVLALHSAAALRHRPLVRVWWTELSSRARLLLPDMLELAQHAYLRVDDPSRCLRLVERTLDEALLPTADMWHLHWLALKSLSSRARMGRSLGRNNSPGIDTEALRSGRWRILAAQNLLDRARSMPARAVHGKTLLEVAAVLDTPLDAPASPSSVSERASPTTSSGGGRKILSFTNGPTDLSSLREKILAAAELCDHTRRQMIQDWNFIHA